jgi:hypothetical protein
VRSRRCADRHDTPPAAELTYSQKYRVAQKALDTRHLRSVSTGHVPITWHAPHHVLFMKILRAGAELLPADRHDGANSRFFCNFAMGPKKRSCVATEVKSVLSLLAVLKCSTDPRARLNKHAIRSSAGITIRMVCQTPAIQHIAVPKWNSCLYQHDTRSQCAHCLVIPYCPQWSPFHWLGRTALHRNRQLQWLWTATAMLSFHCLLDKKHERVSVNMSTAYRIKYNSSRSLSLPTSTPIHKYCNTAWTHKATTEQVLGIILHSCTT